MRIHRNGASVLIGGPICANLTPFSFATSLNDLKFCSKLASNVVLLVSLCLSGCAQGRFSIMPEVSAGFLQPMSSR